MDMTRRTFATGALGFGVASVLGARLEAAGLPWDKRLAADLEAGLVGNPSHARFSVPGVEVVIRDGRRSVEMKAQVRLDWAPGFRLRHFEARARTAEETYSALRRIAFEEFAGVVPGFGGVDRSA